MPLRTLLTCLVAALALACGGSSSDSAAPSQPGTGGTAGGPKLAWDQSAPSADELRLYSYVLYVDGTAVALPGAACGSLSAETFTATCTAPLPTLAPGQRTLEMATRITRDGSVLESARSAPITYVAGASGFASGTAGATASIAGEGTATLGSAGTGTVPTGNSREDATAGDSGTGSSQTLAAGESRFIVEPIVAGLDRPSALARLPDGRLIIAERGGVVRLFEAGVLVREPAVRLADADRADGARVSFALAPDFEASRHLFVGYGAIDHSGSRTGRVVRFREVGGVLGESAVIVDGLPAAVSAPWVAIGPDRALYVGTSSADAGEAADMGSHAGKILRFGLDGATPADNPVPASPVYSSGHQNMAGSAWVPDAGQLWFVEATSAGAVLGIAQAGRPGVLLADMGSIGCAAMAFSSAGEDALPAAWRGSLFVAAPARQGLLRVSGLDASPPSPSFERLFEGRFGPISAMLQAHDGLYLATVGATPADLPCAGSKPGPGVPVGGTIYRIHKPDETLPWRRESP
jgi:glucose/arabinose dehydrogenase